MLKKGVDELANAVKVTLGPKGRNVIIEKKYGAPHITKDGVTVAKEIELDDSVQNLGAQLVKEVASKTGNDAIDLMAAARTSMDGSNPHQVAFTFRHLLAKVNIVATVENGNATVTSVSLSGVTMKGTLRGSTWSETSTGDFSNPSASIPLSVNETSLLGDMLLIPQSVGDFRLTVNYTLDGEEKTYQGNLSTASVTQWEAGNSYKYKLAIKGDNIIFTVKVSEWKTSTGGIITVE